MDLGTRPDTGKKRDAARYQEYLGRAASYYLGRHATSIANFRRVLCRKLRRKGAYDAFSDTVVEGWVNKIVEKYIDLAILDDQAYAVEKGRSLHGRGKSRRAIQSWLREKGVGADSVAQALDTFCEEFPEIDLAAAITLAKRKRLGPFRRDPSGSGERPDQLVITKELGTLARAGFSYAIARSVVDCESEDELRARLDQPYDG